MKFHGEVCGTLEQIELARRAVVEPAVTFGAIEDGDEEVAGQEAFALKGSVCLGW